MHIHVINNEIARPRTFTNGRRLSDAESELSRYRSCGGVIAECRRIEEWTAESYKLLAGEKAT